MVKVSLKGVNTGFESLPPGEYRLTFMKYKEDETDPEKPKYSANFTVKAPDALAGKMAFDRGSLQGHVLFGFKRMIAAFNPNHPALESTKEFDTKAVAQDCIGKEADCVITRGEPYNGRETTNINWILANEKVGAGWAT